ncbi:MAG: XRE family transcriptional regulator [Selenomonadaceae bacterium]|nr:XRE family transcriptional regulator [Selenomonadaceae bacterium]
MTDLKIIESLVRSYIEKNLHEESEPQKVTMQGAFTDVEIDRVDFLKLYAQAKTGGETFSEMLMRLVKESGEKNSTIYNRANIDRRHFSKIATHEDYQPSKQTVLAFAIALKLDFERTKDLLAVAGFSLTKSNIADLIVSFFIEYKIFDVDLVNRILHKYDQPLLGG